MLAALACLAALAPSPAPQERGDARWIWGSWADALERPAGERALFRRAFTLKDAPRDATVDVACDNHFELWVNGKRAGKGDAWASATRLHIGKWLHPGENAIALEGRNDGGPAALLLFLDVELASGEHARVVSDRAFVTARSSADGWTSDRFEARGWEPAREIGPYGARPWGAIEWDAEPRFEPLPGFRVETLAEGMGSLIALARGEGGTIFVSSEGGGVHRLVDRDDDGQLDAIESACDEVTSCQGLCWSKGALFATGDGADGPGLYRIEGGRAKCLGKFKGSGGEHGAHAVVEGPDGRLWISVGNHHQIAAPWSDASPYRIHDEGTLLPRYVDPLGHATKIRSPGGTIVSVDRDGRDWRVIAGGLRNAYDLSFDARGDLFALDSDMEWDLGLPWYRPVRLLHIVPGGEYGWRTGSSVWPEWSPDSLPAAVDVGRGSPTGSAFYGGDAFPARFRASLLAGDWSQGKILAFHLEPRGSSWTGAFETLLSGRPLNVTDLEVDARGALLFTTGGRGTHGGLYRLVYEGPREMPNASPASRPAPRPVLDGAPLARVLDALRSDDRFVRFAAARELERRDPESWIAEAARLEDPRARAEALLALARLKRPRLDDTAALLAAGAEGEARLAALRALELGLRDHAPPAGLGAALLARFPCGDRRADREIAILIAHLAPPGAVDALIAAMEREPSRAEAIHMAYCVRAIHAGWSDDAKSQMAQWLRGARRWSGGESFGGYLDSIRVETFPLLGVEEQKVVAAPALPLPPGAAPKDFDATLAFLLRTRGAARRSPAEGALAFEALCARCHRFGDSGGRVGPDLTTAASRFNSSDLLEATLAPSRTVSDQYRAWCVTTRDGRELTGFVTADDAETLALMQSDGVRIEIPKSQVAERRPAVNSLMPDGLLDGITLEQTADLFAFLTARAAAATPKASAWRPLFDGRTLEGWDGDPELWSVEDGAIVGRARGLPENRFLITRAEYGDFTLELDVQVERGNSGVQFRSIQPRGFVMAGYQADLGETYWGSLYEEGGRGMLAQPAKEMWRSVVDERGFNHLVVEAHGDHVRIELNGLTTVDLHDAGLPSGRIGIQLHGGGETTVRVRNVRIRN